MKRLLNIQDASSLKGMASRAGLPPLDPQDLVRHSPDAHWVLLDEAGQIAGRCSLWWQQTPHHAGHRLGLIGHYAADGEGTGSLLLVKARHELAESGCTLAVGPMDGSTWRHYRFLTEGEAEPPFFLEPANPPDWPRQFIEEGFTPLANYYSSVDDRLEEEVDPQADRAAIRLANLGISLRSLELARFQEELKAIYRIVTTSFRSGFLYQPLPEAEFVAQYEQIRPFVRPELVTIAIHEGRPVGFVFTLPDVLQDRAGIKIETAIIKTLAVLPDRPFAGLGSLLVAVNRRAVRASGCRRLIHALMHESNKSRSISARYATIFRRYTLFAKRL